MTSASETTLRQLVAESDSSLYDPEERLKAGGSLSAVLDDVLFHAATRYWQFTPTHTGAHIFDDRLLSWLQNTGLTRDDRDALLRTVTHIQFVDRDDMLTLYRGAYHGQIRRWLMDQLGIDFSLATSELGERLAAGVARTWFCPVTDSMDIAQFHHVNGLSGSNHRPSFRTLATFGDIECVKHYMTENSLDRLVLLEDFVGSGTQAIRPLRYATSHFCARIPVLFVPLIISAPGLVKIQATFAKIQGFRLEPAFVIPLHVLVSAEPREHEPSFMPRLRAVVARTFESVKLPLPPEAEPLREAFGFGSLGTLVVLHSNCPNNTLPIIWHDAPEWKSLFPRVSRS